MIANTDPTTFTDEDLKILKDTRQYWECRTQSPPELLSRLLIRLELAEKAIRHAYSCAFEKENPGTACSCNVKDWEKVAGKD